MSTIQFVCLKFENHCRRASRMIIKSRGTKNCCELVFPRNVKETTPLKYHQYGCLKITRTMVRIIEDKVDMVREMWESSQGLNPRQSTGISEMLLMGEMVFPREKHLSWLSNTNLSTLRLATPFWKGLLKFHCCFHFETVMVTDTLVNLYILLKTDPLSNWM